MDDNQQQEEDFSKLPLDELVVHKSWKARQCGYIQCSKVFASLDSKDAQFSKYLGSVKKFAADSNVIALEKGLDALLVFVENAAVANKTAGEVCPVVVQKCVGHAKQKIRDKAQEIMLMYVEIEKQDVVIESLITGLSNKNPKVVSACVCIVALAVNQFGAKALGGVKNIAGQLAALLENKDPDVREQTKILAIELFRWVGPAFMPLLSNLKPIQKTELEAEFESVKSEGPPVPARFLRSQKPTETVGTASTSGVSQISEVPSVASARSEPVTVDPWEFLTPVDVLAKLPKDFYEQLESKKWSERKEPLDRLAGLLKDQRLDTKAQYGEIVSVLKRIIGKDSNIQVVASAGSCVTGIALGLRKKFANFAPMVAPVILEKFKDKKPVVVKSMMEAIDAIAKTTTLESLLEDIVASLDNKSPNIKIQTGLFLSRFLAKAKKESVPKKALKVLSAALIKNINDPDPEVRESAAAALGAAMKMAGEKAFLPFISDIAEDHLKMDKIKEFYAKAMEEAGAEVVSSMVQSVHKSNNPAGGLSSTPKHSSASRPPGRRTIGVVSKQNGATKTEGSAPLKVQPGVAAKGRASSASRVPAAATKKQIAPIGPKVPDEPALSQEEADEKAESLFSAEVRAELESAQWKDRLSGLEKMFQTLKSMPVSDVPSQVTILLLNKKKENNVQVLNQKFEIFAFLAKLCPFTACCFSLISGEVFEKIADGKHAGVCKQILMLSAEALSLQFVSDQVASCVLGLKNPRCQSETLLWLSVGIKEFGLEINLKQIIDIVQKALAATNPAVRSAAVELAGILYLFVGSRLRTFFEGEKASLLQTLNAEFEKNENLKPPAATRRWKLSTTTASGVEAMDAGVTDNEDDVDENEDAEDNERMDVTDLIPRKDISDQITDALLEEMANPAWKTREEALEKVKWVISEAKFITPSLGGLPEGLRARLGESNKNLAQLALSICETLATAVGPKIKNHVRIIGPGIIYMLGDSKPLIRQNALSCLNCWVQQCGFKEFLDGEIFPTALKKTNPLLTSELFKWMSEKLGECKKKVPLGDLKLCLPYLYVATEDRNADVRKQSQEAVLPFMKVLGYESMLRASSDLKPPANTNVQVLLDKARAQLPALNVSSATGTDVGNQKSKETPRPGTASSATTRGRSSSRKPGETGRSKKDNEDSFEGGALIDTGQKQQRFQEEKALKVLKWQFSSPTEEHIEQLRNYMSSVAKPALLINLFHSDFRQHLKAIEALNTSIELCPDAVLGASDLLLKWCTLRFFDTNPSVLLKSLDFIKKLLQLHLEQNVELHDYEVASFVPYLLLKAGEAKEMVRVEVRDILEKLTNLYPSSKIFPIVMEGLKTKNSRQKAECLLRLASMIEFYGLSVCGSPQQALKTIAQNIGDRDKDVRNGALTAAVAAYMHAGEKIYKYVGNISEKEYVMLEERIKRSVKNRPLIKKSSPAPDEKKVVVRGKMAGQQSEMNGIENGESDGMEVDENPSVGGSRRHRPRSHGMFHIDYNEIGVDSDEGTDYKMPKLIDHAEVNEILSKPLQMPQIRTRGMSPAKRRGSAASVTSISSIDASTALDNVISQVTSSFIPTAIQALAQLDELIKDNEKSGVLTGKVDQILISLYFQLRMAYCTHMSDESVHKSDVIDLYRQLCAMLLSLLQTGELAKEASEGPLKDLACQLLTVLLDDRLPNVPEGNQVVKSINLLIVKLVEKADATVCLVALMRLLREALNSQTASSKFQELVMKCIWKHTRQLGAMSDTMQLSKVLAEAHQFFVEFPLAYWRQKPPDTPMRTIKTILNTICRAQRDKILDHVGGIENPQNSEVVAYLKKCLREIARNPPPEEYKPVANGHLPSASADALTGSSYNEPCATSQSEPSSADDSEKDTANNNAILAEIFKKIGDKEHSKEGIRELYQFKRTHPTVDVSPYLKKTSSFFRSYIERSLQQVENERWAFQRNRTKEISPEVSGSVPSAFLEKLQQVRSRYGLCPSEVSVKRTSVSDDDLNLPQVKIGSQSERSPPKTEPVVQAIPRTSSADLNELKRRLDQIKRGQQ